MPRSMRNHIFVAALVVLSIWHNFCNYGIIKFHKNNFFLSFCLKFFLLASFFSPGLCSKKVLFPKKKVRDRVSVRMSVNFKEGHISNGY